MLSRSICVGSPHKKNNRCLFFCPQLSSRSKLSSGYRTFILLSLLRSMDSRNLTPLTPAECYKIFNSPRCHEDNLSVFVMKGEDRFSTPPRRCRAISPSSPARPGEIVVLLTGACSGTDLGRLKVRAETSLLEVQSKLLTAVGGFGCKHEAHLVQKTDYYSDSCEQPFKNAASGDTYCVLLKQPLTNTAFLDLARKKK